jgi:plasmid maintenance system antidote protein VapI
MKLTEWLSREGVKKKDFAAMVGASNATISDLCNGKKWIGRELAAAIARVTDGDVTAADFVERSAA